MFLAITDMVPFTAEHTPIMTYFVVATLLLSTLETILCAVIMTIADTEKAREMASAQAVVENSTRKSSLLLQQIHNLTKVQVRERRNSNLGFTLNEEPVGHPGDDDGFEMNRPRSFSSSSAGSGGADSGIIDLTGHDAALIMAYREKQRSRSASSAAALLGGNRGVDGASFFRQNQLRRRVGNFFIDIARSIVSKLSRSNANRQQRHHNSDENSIINNDHYGFVSSKRLNLWCFFLFGLFKIMLIALVSVILYDQSRAVDVEKEGFHAPEYSNCWQ